MSLMVLMLAGAAPIIEVWPHQVQGETDGSLEFTFDLRAVSASARRLQPDDEGVEVARATAVFAELPAEVRVRVGPAPVALGSGRAGEQRPLEKAFAQVWDGPFGPDNPLAKGPGRRLLPALHADQPKILLGVEAILWSVRTLEEGALAAVETETEGLRRELWIGVLQRALVRARSTEGNAREGAQALAVRAAAALGCMDRVRAAALLAPGPELALLVETELARLSSDPNATAAPEPWASRESLRCAWIGSRVMAQPFEPTRAGTSAVLTFLSILDQEPRLLRLWEKVRSRRDRFLGAPGAEPVLEWKAKAAKGPLVALEEILEFLESLPFNERTPPPLLAAPVTPFGRFLSDLTGAERATAYEELASAVEDGRLQTGAGVDAGWVPAREETLAALAAPELAKGLQVDASWKEHWRASFAALQGASRESSQDEGEPAAPPDTSTGPTVRLMIAPVLEVEPMSLAYERAAESLERLVASLTTEGLTHVRPLTGGRGAPVVVEARRWVVLLRGLARVAVAPLDTSGEAAVARRFLAGWRTDSTLNRDVRAGFAAPLALDGQRSHSAWAGIGRRELVVRYASTPPAKLVGATGPFELNTSAAQRYIVPVLVTARGSAPAARAPLSAAAVRAAIDGVGRDPSRIDAALADALQLNSPHTGVTPPSSPP